MLTETSLVADLRRHHLFSRLPEAALQEVCASANLKRVPAGDVGALAQAMRVQAHCATAVAPVASVIPTDDGALIDGMFAVQAWCDGVAFDDSDEQAYQVGQALGAVLAALKDCPPPFADDSVFADLNAGEMDAVLAAVADGRFRFYLAYTALALVTMQSVFAAFVPLFMKEQVGLPSSDVVLLEVAAYFCGILSSYFWGTWTDRSGSRPLVPILALMTLLPLMWMMMPRHGEWSFLAAFGVAGLAGIATTGWWIVDQRLLYVEIVPPAKRTEYMAIYYAWIGLIGGCGPLICGPLLDYFQGLDGQLGPLALDPYSPLFGGSVALLGVSLMMLAVLRRRLRDTARISVG